MTSFTGKKLFISSVVPKRWRPRSPNGTNELRSVSRKRHLARKAKQRYLSGNRKANIGSKSMLRKVKSVRYGGIMVRGRASTTHIGMSGISGQFFAMRNVRI